MGFNSTLSVSSRPKISFSVCSRRHELQSRNLFFVKTNCGAYNLLASNVSFQLTSRRRSVRLRSFVTRVVASRAGGSRIAPGGRRVYKQSQSEASLPLAAVKDAIAFVVPAGVFVVVTFVLWKLVEKLLVPKQRRESSSSEENKFSIPRIKWSFAPGTNLSSGLSFKDEKDRREKKEKLNDFAKELRSFSSVNMSGLKFGDDGLFFLAESLGYNQAVEEVDFSANDITAIGLKAFDGILQSNIVLKTLNLSGNLIGDEGAKGHGG